MCEKKKIAIFISGRGSNMHSIIENAHNGILKDCCQVVLVFSNVSSAPGLEIARKYKIDAAFIESNKIANSKEFSRALLKLLARYRIDYIVLAGYMKIVSSSIIKQYRGKIINIHPADTFLHKGLNGYLWAYQNNLKMTAITIHWVDEGLDTGKVIAKIPVDISQAKTLEEVEKIGLIAEHQHYSKVLCDIFTNNLTGNI